MLMPIVVVAIKQRLGSNAEKLAEHNFEMCNPK